MTTRSILLLALFVGSTMHTPAAALPRTAEALDIQKSICERGTQLIIDGATDEQEAEFWRVELQKNGWTEPDDFDDLQLICLFFKYGYLYRHQQD